MGSQHPEGLRREVALVGLQLRRRWDLTHALFFLRVAAALAAVARRLRVAAALRPAARRFLVCAAF